MIRLVLHDDEQGAGRLNDPPVLILTSLASGSKHGYALLGDIDGFAGVRLGPGTLYGAISRLEERGLIEAVGAAGRRRPYRLTAAGAAALQRTLTEQRTIVDKGAARLARDPVPRVASLGAGMNAPRIAGLLVRRLYPAAWRARYGQELEALIVESSGGQRVPWRVCVDVVLAGGREWLRAAGLAGARASGGNGGAERSVGLEPPGDRVDGLAAGSDDPGRPGRS